MPALQRVRRYGEIALLGCFGVDVLGFFGIAVLGFFEIVIYCLGFWDLFC